MHILQLPVVREALLPLVQAAVQLHRNGVILILLIQSGKSQLGRDAVPTLYLSQLDVSANFMKLKLPGMEIVSMTSRQCWFVGQRDCCQCC